MNESASAAQCFEANAIANARLTVQRIEEDRIAAAIMADSVATKAVQDPRYSLERFKERLRNEDAMKDTETPPLTHPTTELLNENALLRRSLSVLTTRIEELESEIDKMRGDLIDAVPDLERIAHTLKRFYFAELSLSSVQPIIQLAFELNPDLVEQKR